MKWYFALNATSLNSARGLWEPMILAALKSAEGLDLAPHLLFDGPHDPFFTRLASRGVTIVPHQVSFFDRLVQFGRDNAGYLSTASGAFLRVELPLVEMEHEVVLYTDCDVLFSGTDMPHISQPAYFGCAPEFDKNDYAAFNTGVMVMNIPSLRKDLPDFTKYICNNLDKFQTYDQDAYRTFYAGRADPLPLTMNWKPYWGVCNTAEIIHFHGPKPSWVRHMLENPDDDKNPSLSTILNWNLGGYQHYLKLWDQALNSSDQ